jgi:hypothetical protein
LTNVPPLQTNNPTLQDIIAHRDIKARYLLTMVSERMREYRRAKGLKDPVQFKDSMIVLTPQKEGDSSDPWMPLNFAHGEREPESHTQNPRVRVEVSEDMQTVTARLPLPLSVVGGLVPSEFPSILDNAASGRASSSENFFSYVQIGESDPDGDNYEKLQPTHPQTYAASATVESLSAPQYDDMRGGNPEIDPQMLEIDWVSDMNPCSLASLSSVTDTINRIFGTLSSRHRQMMATWTLRTIICGRHTALTTLPFDLTVYASKISIYEKARSEIHVLSLITALKYHDREKKCPKFYEGASQPTWTDCSGNTNSPQG